MFDQKMCDVVRDLMPLYVDGLTSEASNQLVTDHMKNCEECSRFYSRMIEPEAEVPNLSDTQEIDFLRKTKKRGLRNLLIVITAAVLTVLAVFSAYFFHKKPLTFEEYAARVSVEEEAGTDKVRIYGTVIDAYRYRGCRFDESEDGIVRLTIEGSPAFRSGKDRTFDTMCSMSHSVKQVWIGDILVWEDNVEIPTYASKLFSAKIPYVGNNSGVGNILSILDLQSSLGGYTFSLQTSKEPYGLTVHLSEPLDEQRVEAAKERMRGYACVLLSLIDNLGEASFEYHVNSAAASVSDASDSGTDSTQNTAELTDENDSGTYAVKVTATEAGKIAGYNIKEAAKSAVAFRQMLTDLDLIDNYVSVKHPGIASGVRLNVILNTKHNVDYVSLDLLSNGTSVETTGTVHADGSAWTPGETVDFTWDRDEFGSIGGISDGDTFTVQISLETSDGTFHSEPLSLVFREGTVYETVLTDNEDGGYVLSAK